MSNAPSTLDAQRTTEIADNATDLLDLVRSATETITAPLRFAGFWSAVLLPLLYVPMVLGGVAARHQSAFAVLIALHAVALVAGHGYRSE